MSSHKDKFGYVEFECDSCGEVDGTEEKGFADGWLEAQRNGWKYKGGNVHQCPTCADRERNY